MTVNSKIAWTDHTWTPIVGCDAVSPACANCYAALMAARLEAMGQEKYRGVAVRASGKGKWTGLVKFWQPDLMKPLGMRKPARWFLTSMGDVFHRGVSFDDIDRLFAVMALANWHTFLVLTKRPERACEYLTAARATAVGMEALATTMQVRSADPRSRVGAGVTLTGDIAHLATWPLPNVFVGCTAENQERADELRPHMAAMAARGWRTFVSYEPALGPVDWTGWEFLQQLIVGGESGPRARDFDIGWARSSVEWCRSAGLTPFVKQMGARPVWSDADEDSEPPHGGRLKYTDRAGGDWLEWPADLRVREFPGALHARNP